jgi:1-deoxy-D-xylulose-5-phosphate synthase
MDHQILVPVTRIGVPDQLVEHATPDQSKAALGLMPAQVVEQVLGVLQKQPAPSYVA